MSTIYSSLRPASSASQSGTRFSQRPVRSTLLALASLVVVAATALFLLGSAQSATVSFNLTSYSVPGHDVVVYGEVTNASNDRVSDASVLIYQVVHGHESVLARVVTNSQGLYRVALRNLSESTLHMQISKRLDSRRYLGTISFSVRSGGAYEATARLLHRGWAFPLPVWSY
ncbi:MAG TPA: hypothetical protein VHO07_06330 [Streptosporangiaceae bacterium]|jgi:hypothetical protein|nr:hypothetical protein [Streptosporangiaceae bacterium]